MESLSRELALAVMLHLHPRDVAQIVLVSRCIRGMFMLYPEDHKFALQHLQRHGDPFEVAEDEGEDDADSDDGEDDEDGDVEESEPVSKGYRPLAVPFHRLPLAYSLALLAWKGMTEKTIAAIFPDMIAHNLLSFDDGVPIAWDKPLSHPAKVEKLLQMSIEFDFDIISDRIPEAYAFYLSGMLDSVELTNKMINKGVLSAKQRTALELVAMHGACYTGAVSVAQHLLTVSSADLRNDHETFPLYTCALSGHMNVMRLLLAPVDGVAPEIDIERTFDDLTPLQWAATQNHTEAVLCLIEHGANPLVGNQTEDGLLSQAVQHRNTILAKVALDRGASVHVECVMGRTPLKAAVIHDDTEMARLLIAHGAAYDEPDEQDFTPLHYAVFNNNLQLFNLLLSAGADPIARANNGLTLLHYAAAAGRLEIVQRLHSIDAVARQARKDVEHGMTVLMFAAYNLRLEVVQWLLDYGGWAKYVNAKDDDDRTALEYASESFDIDDCDLPEFVDASEDDQEDVVALLLQYGALKRSSR
ncbi:hypothetical protein HDU96_003435 [Phlyctochytrium bullatum]|nr:hypothetical protein HDU96_003435 [Phlyctochytrium bullatum]